jgi:two-component system OmpR family response regulator
MKPVNILVVEDDEHLSSVLKRGLSKLGHVVDCVGDGLSGKAYADDARYDVMIFDVMLPGLDGIALVKTLRGDGIETPVLMLTARDTVSDLVTGLDAGANDYLRKPFVFAELDARLRAIARRTVALSGKFLSTGDISLDLATREVRRSGKLIPLTSRECAFLEYFMRRRGRLVTRAMLESALWEHGKYIESNIVEVYVSRLRTKLRIAGRPPVITTLRGSGYRFG